MLIYIMKTSRHYMAQILSKVAIKTNNNTNIADESTRYRHDITLQMWGLKVLIQTSLNDCARCYYMFLIWASLT